MLGRRDLAVPAHLAAHGCGWRPTQETLRGVPSTPLLVGSASGKRGSVPTRSCALLAPCCAPCGTPTAHHLAPALGWAWGRACTGRSCDTLSTLLQTCESWLRGLFVHFRLVFWWVTRP